MLKVFPHIDQLHIIRSPLTHALQDLLEVPGVQLLNGTHASTPCCCLHPPAQHQCDSTGHIHTHACRCRVSNKPPLLRAKRLKLPGVYAAVYPRMLRGVLWLFVKRPPLRLSVADCFPLHIVSDLLRQHLHQVADRPAWRALMHFTACLCTAHCITGHYGACIMSTQCVPALGG